MKSKQIAVILAIVGTCPAAMAFTFENESVKGSFDSTITFGFGKRMQSQDCSLVGDVTGPCGANADWQTWSNGDDGNLNYNKGDFFTAYLKGNHELVMKMPSDLTVMARANWLYDWAARKTQRTPLQDDAKRQLAADVNLLDLWISKGFQIGEHNARVRIGQQAINWGESLFAPGGINATNALDINRLSSPGMQLKEVVLPAPMVSLATGLGKGVNIEGYYQFQQREGRLPPAGSYWSSADIVGKGSSRVVALDASGPPGVWLNNGIDPATYARLRGIPLSDAQSLYTASGSGGGPLSVVAGAGIAYGDPIALLQAPDQKAKNSGQYGLSLRWKPEGMDTDFGAYYLNYHDKLPNLRYWRDANSANGAQAQLVYLEDRKLYGVSANTTLGNWAVGAELSYRPKDAVSLSACSDPAGQTAGNFITGLWSDQRANCDGWIDMKKYQLHVTGILSLTPGDHGAFLKLVGADTATFLGEFVWTRYPDADPNKIYSRSVTGIDGSTRVWEQVIAAGAYTFPGDATKTGVQGTGSRDSYGYMFDFSLVYDSTLIPGWQVIPGVFVQHALKGETPNISGFWMEGAKAANFYVNFVKNPAKWQAGLNYTTFWGGKTPYHQYLKDRDFVGAYVSYNF